MFVFRKIFLTTIALTLFASQLSGQAVSRRILALYDGGSGQTINQTHIHGNAEVILNHLGCMLDYWDISKGLPNQAAMKKYLGILTWFYSDEMVDPETYLKWAIKQIDAGKKFVILGDLGAVRDKRPNQLVNAQLLRRFCRKVGFEYDSGKWTNDITKIDLAYKDPSMVEFERTLDYELTTYRHFTSINPENKVYLKLRRNDLDGESDVVITTPNGGLATSGYVVYQNGETFKKKWRINPFKFFEEAFGLKGRPRPDVTTLNGLRIWCSHIDGDALISKSLIKPNTYCGEIIRDEILAKYKWPVSVSVVVSEIETDEKFENIARSIYKLDWIEAASHSYSHPFYWADDYAKKDQYEARHLEIAGYKFNLKDEIIGSVKYINERLLPRDKKIKQFFWTGNCEPTAEALRFCRQININNINGGDTIFDKTFPSYTNVAPLSVDVDGYRQIYAPNANENIYTDGWRGPYYGFKFVLDTFKNTESPIRIKPIDIYYHFYIGERWAALNSLKEVLSETTAMNVAPMFMSDYIDITQGFFETQIEEFGRDNWKIKNYGKCTTIRFDDTQKFPDLNISGNVLGFNHYQGSLYVHLDNTDEAVIFLTSSKPTATYLAQGSHRVFDWNASQKKVTFKSEGFGKGRFVIANLEANADYQVFINRQRTLTARSDPDGTLAFKHAMAGAIRVQIDLAQ